MAFDSEVLLDRLQALTADSPPLRWLVAFSGGIDSTVLLHALAKSATAIPILAIHVDHGAHAESARWEKHCRQAAGQFGVGYQSHKVAANTKTDSGPEAALREARYAALLAVVRQGDCLLSAHQEDDQAETLLLNLMRGSGPAGLAGIGVKQSFGRGQLLRPLLGVGRESIRRYAEQHDLTWIDDPSNVDTRFDRNFLREQVMPVLAARWPAAAKRLRRSAELTSEASELLNDLGDIDLAVAGGPDRLDLATLSRLSSARQRNVIRRAVRLCGLPPPPATRLYQALHELIPARADAEPLVTWPGAEMRRHRGSLYIMAAVDSLPAPPSRLLRPGSEAISLGPGLGSLRLVQADGVGIDPLLAQEGLAVRYRKGGEGIRVAPQGRTRKLKKLMQEEGIVPWMRGRLPLLFAGSKLVAVGDLWVSVDCLMESGFSVVWHDKPALR